VSVAALSSCTLEPIRSDNGEMIKGAPDWVNKGSYFSNTRDGNMFYGVSYSSPQGDVALQKSIADDSANAELVRVLGNYLDIVSNEFLLSARSDDGSAREDSVYRRIELSAIRQVNESISSQIDDAISRQFKAGVSAQFKEDVKKNVMDASAREVREATSYQIDLLRHVEDVISRQLKDSASRQMRGTAKAHLVNARILSNWRDPRTSAIFSLSELDLRNVKKTMAGINDMNIELKQFFDINAEPIFDRIMRERNNLNPFSLK